VTKIGRVVGLANRHLFPEFGELWTGGPAIPCGDMHQSFTDALVSSFVNFLLWFGAVDYAIVRFISFRIVSYPPWSCNASITRLL